MVHSRVARSLLCLCITFLTFPLIAQQTGAVRGKVTATDGSVLPGVTVEAKSNSLPQPRVTLTDSSGDYRLPALQPGAYTLSYTLAGMQTVTRKANVLLAQEAAIDVKLGVAGVAETITVTAESTLVDKESTALQSGLSTEQIQALPVAQDYKDLQKLIPGVMYTQDLVRGPSAGGSGQDNVYLFDGVNVTMPLFGVLSAEPSTHDIAQVNTIKGGAKAVDFERSGGFSIDSVSKSGTNQFSGQVSYQVLKHGFIADQSGTVNSRFQRDRDWAVANLGGPILSDKLFFYGSWYRPTESRDNQANLYGDLPGYESTRDEYFGKLTFTPTAAWLINGSYRDSHHVETGDTFSSTQAATSGQGWDTRLKIGTLEGSWIVNQKSFGTFKYTDYKSPGGNVPDNVADAVFSSALGTHLDIANLDKIGRLIVPTLISGNAGQNAFVQPYIDKYGYVQNGVRTGGGTVGYALYSHDNDDFFRKSGQVGYNYSLGSAVSHDLHVGYQRYTDSEDRFQTSNGWGSLTIPGGNIKCPTSVASCSGQPVFFQAQFSQQSTGVVPTIHSEFKSQNVEINDTIRMNDWTFNVGVLASNDKLYGQGLAKADNIAGFVTSPGTKYLMHETPFSDQIQPRLGATWAYNSVDTVYVSYARYFPAANSDARAASWDRNLIATKNAYFDASGTLIGVDPIGSSSGKLFQEGIKPRHTDEYLVGTAQQVTNDLSARIYGRYRKSVNFWEDTNNDARTRFGAGVEGIPQELFIPNLGSTSPCVGLRCAIGSGSSYVIANIDGAFTKYYEATAEGDWHHNNTFLRGSYTWSHYYGNFDQDNSSFNTANDAAIFIGSSNIADGAGRQLWNYKYGDLRGDRRNVFKVYGTQMLPWNGSVGAFWLYQSGQPYQLESYLPYVSLTTNTSDTARYAEPAGRRRSPNHHQMDVNYTQNIGLPRGLNLQVLVDVFNLYNKQTGYNYESRVGTLGKCNTSDCLATGLAAQPSVNAPFPKSFYDPRRFQIAARLQF